LNSTGDTNIDRRGLDEATVRQYLLDELAPDERGRLEERLMTEDALFARLVELEEAQEDELIDQYVHEQLSADERERFERVFLSTTERREKLNLVRELKSNATSEAFHARHKRKGKKKKGPGSSYFLAFFQFQNSLVGFSLSVALLLAVVGGLLLFSRVRRLESELSQLRAERLAPPLPAPTSDQELARLRARNEELEAGIRQSDEERGKLNQELAALKSQGREVKEPPTKTPPTSRQTPVLSLVLPLVSSRSLEPGQDRQLALPAGPSRVRLLLDLDIVDPDDYKKYRVVLKSRNGNEVWRDNRPLIEKSGDQSRIVVSPPARLLNTGEYLVELSGIPESGSRIPIGIYSFRVTKK
jgi:hypothetical protein